MTANASMTIASPGRPQTLKRVRTAFDMRKANERLVAHGVLTFFQSIKHVFVDLDQDIQQLETAESSSDCVGLIISAEIPLFDQICSANKELPIVVVSCGRSAGGLKWNGPCIDIDDSAVGTMGAQHLIDCGFQHFSFCSYPAHQSQAWCRERGIAFAKQVSHHKRNCELHICRNDPSQDPRGFSLSLQAWLDGLSKPIGIMAADDRLAHRLLLACQELGLQMPEQVAVLGVNNDEFVGSFSSDFLSSVDLAVAHQGKEAASLLVDLMAGEASSPLHRRLQPVEIIRRASTDVMAIKDVAVLQAMEYIRDFACDRITAENVAERVAVSRSYLDSRFKKHLGCTIFQAIQKCRRDKAVELLTDGQYTTKQVAELVGYSSTQHLSTDIRVATGRTPGQFREERQAT